MTDERIHIPEGRKIAASGEQYFIINQEIGRGGSSIVYSAVLYDEMGQQHVVRVKECYPWGMDIVRTKEGELEASEAFEERFCEAKKKFVRAYERNVNLKNTLGLMNSTTDAIGIYSRNNTWYSVISAVEGQSYRSFPEEAIHTVFIRMLALAKVIKKYHSNGVLHLDIKPENIFILPETNEHIMLYDFDSLLWKEELKDGSALRISFSDGYAAPELAQGNRKKICEATDIYSIGAIVFERIFKRTPTAMDGAVGCRYDFSALAEKDERYQPEFFSRLRVFFHKTIASAVRCRYQNINLLIEALEGLIEASDVERTFLFHNFSYHFSEFVARREELLQIENSFEEGNHVLFLSGIGGIGKTELAKRYAYEYSGQYDRIVFLPFEQDIIDTVCGEELSINQISQAAGESQEKYFLRKIKVLKTITTHRDLIILDNFDVEEDENLELLLECPCRFLITTREDFRDYGYEQLTIEKFRNDEELFSLFRCYNSCEYSAEEIERLKDIFELVDGHTMTIGLIAKYLRMTEGSPGELLEHLMEKEGITNTGEIHVRHRKDRGLNARSIHSHLLALFDIFGFSVKERELMGSLSLLGRIRIKKEKLLEYCPIENASEILCGLIARGWIECEETTGKVSLHQMILDLVYNDLSPNSKNCPHIVDGITTELKKKPSNQTEKQVMNRLFKEFMERMRGDDLPYAALCVEYSAHIEKRLEYLKRAEEICQKVCRDQRKAYDLLQRICRIRILMGKRIGAEEIEKSGTGYLEFEDSERFGIDFRKSGIGEKSDGESGEDGIFGTIGEEDDDTKEFIMQASYMCHLAIKAIGYAQKYSDDAAYLGRFLVHLAEEMDRVAAAHPYIQFLTQRDIYADRLYEFIIKLFDMAEEKLLAASKDKSFLSDSMVQQVRHTEESMDSKEKRKLFGKMQEFFGSYDFCAVYRSENYCDLERAGRYQEIMDSVKEDNRIFDMMDFINLAQEAEERGEYQSAISFYKKAYEDDSNPRDWVIERMAEVFRKIGDEEQEQRCLEELLSMERDSEGGYLYSFEACDRLIGILRSQNKPDEARAYAKEMLAQGKKRFEKYCHDAVNASGRGKCDAGTENAPDRGEDEDPYSLIWMTVAEFYLYEMEETEQERKEHWEAAGKQLESFYHKGTLPYEFLGFLGHFLDRLEDDRTKVKQAFSFLERLEDWYQTEKILSFLETIDAICDRNDGFTEEKIRLYLYYGKCMMSAEGSERAWKYFLMAEESYEKLGHEDKLLYNMIHRDKGECYQNMAGYSYENVTREWEKCDFYFLAQKESEGKSSEKQIEAWENAAENCRYLEQYDREEQCRDMILDIFRSLKKEERSLDLKSYFRQLLSQAECCLKLGKQDRVRKLVMGAYERIIGIASNGMEIKLEDILWGLEEGADILMKGGWKEDAVRLYLVVIVLGVSGQKNKRHVFHSYHYDTASVSCRGKNEHILEDALSEFFSKALHEEDAGEKVDFVLRIFAKIDPDLREMAGYEDFLMVLEWYRERYQNFEVELLTLG